MKKITVLLIVILSAIVSHGQQNYPKNKQELVAVCDKFLDSFKNGKYTEAYELLKHYTVIENYKIDTLALTTKQQMISVSSSFGKPMSFEKISEKPVKNSLVKLTYLLYFEQSFLKFRFILYNNGNGWTITNFTYNDEIDELF